MRLYEIVSEIPIGDELIAAAKAFAIEVHGAINHVRKYTGVPYVEHLFEVAGIVASRPHTPEMVAAALLHDTVEDTSTTLADIQQRFGPVVAALVENLTDVSKPGDGNRAIRKGMDLAHTAGASNQAKTIKLADLISNGRDIQQNDMNFAKVYMREKRELLKVLVGGDAELYAIAQKMVSDYFQNETK